MEVPIADNCLALDYRFLSEEFPEFVGSPFNDAFIAEVDSSSWSVAGGGELSRSNDFAASLEGTPISVNGVGPAAVTPEEAEGTYFDAATGLITTKALIVPTSVTAAAAGPVTLTIRLTGPAKKVLAKKHKLKVSVALTFTPIGGSPASQVRTLTFKKPAKHKKHH